ncbi:MAG: SDR family NAD(P)-dependent oxidoreductase [Chloroflexi bacterium]|nr:SDR family NAD(P)-dependent oxidoreductase [Chloroflexota bacterium]
MKSTIDRAVAIVGVGALLPDAPNAPAFWKNICDKRYSIVEVPPERWSIADYYDPDATAPDKTYSKIGSWIRGFEFDWKRFRIPPRVAAAMDEGQQWALTIAAEALADYGYPDRALDTERTGVVLGTAMGGELHYQTALRIDFPEYAHALEAVSGFRQLTPDVRTQILEGLRAEVGRRLPAVTEDSMPGELPNIVSGRVANVLNLRGPNYITDAACASSFAAVDAAVELLIEHHCDAVITGGVDRNMAPHTFVKFCKIGALSATGSRPFGEGADGFVMGEGAAAFLLKRLADAERDGDKIYAVIRGVGGASDGKGKGITAPNPVGQELAISRAWANAGLDPATVSLIEAHGTSTRVGDVVEVESLAKVFGAAPAGSIPLGSVKSNIGHLKAGAGAAGLLKATMALFTKKLPPTLNAEQPNPNINFGDTPFYLNHELREWPQLPDTLRRAGVSAYGFGGTNFHVVLEEYISGGTGGSQKAMTGKIFPVGEIPMSESASSASTSLKNPVRGIVAIGGNSSMALKTRTDAMLGRIADGWIPGLRQAPDQIDLQAPERLVIDFGSREELADRLQKAQKALDIDTDSVWKALQPQGIFRGSGPMPGKVAFLFPGQGSQYLNMGRELAAIEPVVARTLAEADQVMEPILGRPLTDYIFVNTADPEAVKVAEAGLVQTAITQPAMLAVDIALYRLLGEYGFKPDMVMGHSLGEYAGLIVAGVMPFADALEATAARGREMTKLAVGDNGWMAAVMAPYGEISRTLAEIDGYVVAANINSNSQSVIGGNSEAVAQAIKVFEEKGYQAMRIPVSHAFHTRIVAPASQPLRQVLNRLRISPPRLPLVANVNGDFYPAGVEQIKDILEQQIASPVQWIKGLETLYSAGARTFVEVGPKKALKGFTDDVLGNRPGVVSLFTNHPKTGELPTFNQVLCGLYAAGYGVMRNPREQDTPVAATITNGAMPPDASRPLLAPSSLTAQPLPGNPTSQITPPAGDTLAQLLAQALQKLAEDRSLPNGTSMPVISKTPYDRNDVPVGSVVISGTGLGLPGAEKSVMDPDNALRILCGDQFIDLIPERFRKLMLRKHVTRLVKSADGSGSLEAITDPDEVIKLAGRPGYFDLTEEYGVPEKLVEALDITTQLAIAAGLDALREAGIPLVQTYKRTTTGKYLPERWLLPESMRDETGVIFASAFPGGDRFADEFTRYYTWENRHQQLEMLEDLRQYTKDPDTLCEIMRLTSEVREKIEREPYIFDRRFLFRILSMGHSQFAEYIGARGPNAQVNAACASTTEAVAIAEDWIRSGRCRRVVVVAADDVTGDNLMEWIGAGFLATGAAATDDRVEEAALPFDRRRHGTIMGMGACSLVVESEDTVRERGFRGMAELLGSEAANSAYHGTRLDVNHISHIMDNLVTAVERRFGVDRRVMSSQMVFMSHETYTPARGGSASAEVAALRHTFGAGANQVVMANTKGFTGHPMGVGVEDVIAVKILEYGIVPPVPNFREVDPDLGPLTLSRGGRYPVLYALHLAAGFGSQIAMTLIRRIPGGLDRIADPPLYQRWLADVSGYEKADTEIVKRVLRIVDQGVPGRQPAPSNWKHGTGPALRTPAFGDGISGTPRPPQIAVPEQPLGETKPYSVPTPLNGDGHGKTRELETPKTKPEIPSTQPKHEESGTVGANLMKVTTPAIVQEQSLQGTKFSEDKTPAQVDQAPQEVATAPDPVVDRVLQIVVQKTGYPRDMLDMDMDLEADLGIDTVKQAETFAAIREAFDIPRRDNLRLRDYPTLASVVQFVHDNCADLQSAAPQAQPIASEAQTIPAESSRIVDAVSKSDAVTEKILEIVAGKTGYPQDMLDMDLDLEADLGIDTVKQAETFAAIREAFDIPRRDDLRLRDYPTLASVVQFVYDNRPDLRQTIDKPLEVSDAEPFPVEHETTVPLTGKASDSVRTKVLEIVAGKTGYPQDMLDMDLDLEADLGIDTVKQAETFVAIREAFGIPRKDNLKLRDYPTLASVVQFVYDSRPDLQVTGKGLEKDGKEEKGPGEVAILESVAPSAPIGTMVEANSVPRRVPVPTLRPSLDWCKATGVTLGRESRVVVGMDQGGVGKELVQLLERQGVHVFVVDTTYPAETGPVLDELADGQALEEQVKAWVADGTIQGVYWLPALDMEPGIEEMDLATWRGANWRRIKKLFILMRALLRNTSPDGSQTDAGRAFLVTATRNGGLHGYGAAGALSPLGGAVTGFTKAYKRERPETHVKAVDFEAPAGSREAAEWLIAETLRDPGIVEVGYQDGLRYGITLEEMSASDGRPGIVLNKQSAFLVTGAAGGITSAIVADLAAASGGVFYLLDLVPAPAMQVEMGKAKYSASPNVQLFRTDKEALKSKLVEDLKAAGERPTPVKVDRQLLAVEREDALLRTVESIQAGGGEAHYHAVNLLDGPAVAKVMDEIRQKYGHIDILIHAAGMEISRALQDKELNEFNLVYDVKAEGFYNVLRAAAGMPIRATVAFSSVAGRFGNSGQADYSAANDLLCKVTSSLRNWRPETRSIVIDWTAWGGIGMATRGSIPKIMEMAGIDMLSPEAGIPIVRRELTFGSTRGEVLIGRRLGKLVEEWDAQGGLDPNRAAQQLAAQPPVPLMIGEVKSARLFEGIAVETLLDPQAQPFLADHQIDGTPVLPGVMGIEAFAQLAHLLAPKHRVVAVENIKFSSPFKFYRNQPRTLYLQANLCPPIEEAQSRSELVLRVALKSAPQGLAVNLEGGDGLTVLKVHFTANVRISREPVPAPKRIDELPLEEEMEISRDRIYRVFFHGPAYQVLERVQIAGEKALGYMAPFLPPDTSPADAEKLIEPRLIELCFQTAGVWEIVRKGRMALPLALESVSIYCHPDGILQQQIIARVTALEGGEKFDAQVVTHSGEVLVALRGYQTVGLTGEVAL